MKSSVSRDSTLGSGPRVEPRFKWDCPYCGESRLLDVSGEEEATEALRSHIVGADDVHGPRNEEPVDGERTLFEYVCLVNDER